jgi:hypothetical protein
MSEQKNCKNIIEVSDRFNEIQLEREQYEMKILNAHVRMRERLSK